MTGRWKRMDGSDFLMPNGGRNCLIALVDRPVSIPQDTDMTRDEINTLCQSLPGAENSDPWGGGHDVWKVGGKMFACIGALMPGVSVKTESIEMAQMLIDAGVGTKAPYFHRSWLLVPPETDREETAHRIRTSYDLIRSRLPKKVQATLG